MRTHTQTFTEKDVYGFEDVPIPEGYEYVRFGLVGEGEEYLNRHTATEVCSWGIGDQGDIRPRIIVKKKVEFVIEERISSKQTDNPNFVTIFKYKAKQFIILEKT